MTVADAVKKWLASRRKIAPSTLANYKTMAKNHVEPTAVGRKSFTTLTAEDVEELPDLKAKTLSPRSVKLIRTILERSNARSAPGDKRGEVEVGGFP